MSNSLKDELPKGWIKTTIGEVTIPKVRQGMPDVKESITYIDISSIDNRLKQIVNPKKIEATKAPSRARQKVFQNDVLVSMTRPNLNAVAKVLAELDGSIASSGFDVLRPIMVEPSWLFSYVKSSNFVETMVTKVQGALYPAVKSADIRSFEIKLPPLNEQKRIVYKIEALQAKSKKAKQALEIAKPLLGKLRQSILASTFRGDLTADWRKKNPDVEPASVLLERIRAERRKKWEENELAKMRAQGKEPKNDNWKAKYKEPKPVDTKGLPKLPNKWCWANLNELKEFSIYGPRFSSKDYAEEGILVLRTSDIDDIGKVDVKKTPKLSLDDATFSKYCLNIGDLLITRTGSIGTLAVFNDTVQAIPGAYLIHYRLCGPRHLSWFVFFQLKSPRGQFCLTGGAAGIGRPNLNAPTIEAIPIALPPQSEQEAIIKKIQIYTTIIDKNLDVFKGLRQKLDSLDQSILQKAFQGKLVGQDPSEEDAAALLELIQVERRKKKA
jgi:type I restriction enzyme, S subunit